MFLPLEELSDMSALPVLVREKNGVRQRRASSENLVLHSVSVKIDAGIVSPDPIKS